MAVVQKNRTVRFVTFEGYLFISSLYILHLFILLCGCRSKIEINANSVEWEFVLFKTNFEVEQKSVPHQGSHGGPK